MAERERRPPNPPTRVGNVVIFANGEVLRISLKEQRKVMEGGKLVLDTPPYRRQKEIVYGCPH